MYWRRIEQLKKGNMNLYKQCLVIVFGDNAIPWSDVKEADIDKQRELYYELDTLININKSPIDIKKMTRAIQDSRSGIGGSAFTKFTCAFCGREELWSNTAVPRICRGCATDMATQIAIYHYDVLK